MLCDLGNVGVVLFLLLFDGLPLNVKILQRLPHHVGRGDLLPNLIVVARCLCVNHDALLALGQDDVRRLGHQLLLLYLPRRIPEGLEDKLEIVLVLLV